MGQLENKKKKREHETEFEVISGGQRTYTAAQHPNEETEIDLLELGYVLLDKLYYIIACFLIGAVLMNAYAFFFITPTYQSTAKMYVVSASDDSVVDLTDLNIGSSLKSDYEELMMSYPVLDQVIAKLDLDMDYEQLGKMISITNPSDTRILDVTVTSTDPVLARDIANTVVEVSVDYLPKTMGTEEPNIAQEARVANSKVAPSYAKYTVMGALLGAILCCAWIIIRHLMDDTFHTAEEIEKYFGIVPLTTIPDMASLNEKRGTKKNKKNSRKKSKSR
jgi:capsular polysaccharide biosynthesis protein